MATIRCAAMIDVRTHRSIRRIVANAVRIVWRSPTPTSALSSSVVVGEQRPANANSRYHVPPRRLAIMLCVPIRAFCAAKSTFQVHLNMTTASPSPQSRFAKNSKDSLTPSAWRAAIPTPTANWTKYADPGAEVHLTQMFWAASMAPTAPKRQANAIEHSGDNRYPMDSVTCCIKYI